MEVFFKVYINFEQNNQVKLLLIVEFIYNNAKNIIANTYLFNLSVTIILMFYIKNILIYTSHTKQHIKY